MGGASWDGFGHVSCTDLVRPVTLDFSVAGRPTSDNHTGGMLKSGRHVSGSLTGGFSLHYNMKGQRFEVHIY